MRRSLMAFMLFCLAGPALAADLATIGAAAPDFTATDALTGKPVTLADLKGKPVVLEWNNFDCPFVKAHYAQGAMQTLQESSVADGAVWITINSSGAGQQGYFADDSAAKKAAADHTSHASHYLRDPQGEIGKRYGATTTPHMFVIDAQGVLVYRGAINSKPSTNADDIPQATNYVSKALAALGDNAPVEPASTQPYGCGVKYGF